MSPWILATITASLLSLPLAATAQTTKPGLWEMSQKPVGNAQADAAMAQMRQQMANMSPEQRKTLQDSLAKQGVSMPSTGADGAMAVKVCITPEMAARKQPPPMAKGDCQSEVVSSTGSTMQLRFSCKQPPSTGEGSVTFQGDSAYTSVMNVRSQAKGKPETVRLEGQGRWLAASCGDIKPLDAPAK